MERTISDVISILNSLSELLEEARGGEWEVWSFELNDDTIITVDSRDVNDDSWSIKRWGYGDSSARPTLITYPV